MNYRVRLPVVWFVLTVATAALLPPRAQYDCTGISPTANATLAGTVVATGLSLPTFVSAPAGDPDRIFILEKVGRIKIHKRGQTAATLTTFLDISSRVSANGPEMGLLGLAFDPDYANTRRFWVDYTETVGGQIYTVIARYTASAANPDVADTTEVRLFRVAQPEDNHNGGMLAFGSDGFLYVGMGDGGGAGDNHPPSPCGNGQNRAVLLGKMLRVDVRDIDPAATSPDCGLGGANYKIPTTNPFRDGSGGLCDEIWDYGLRNPWRPSVDALNGDLYIADVGQNCTEEVNFEPSSSPGGLNYGWRAMEGLQCFDPNNLNNCNPSGAVCAGSPPCHDPSITLPVLQYAHSGGACSVTGGYVYRGCRMPGYRGRYFYGDYCSGKVNSFVMSGGVVTSQIDVSSQVDPSATLNGGLSSFGVDGQGEIYAVSLNGFVRKFVPPFTDLEVSGSGAAALKLSKGGAWSWENLSATTDYSVSYYRVYRGPVGGPYSCVFKATTASWPGGGDIAVPPVGQLFAYVITAVNASGQETKPGTSGSFNPTTCP
jgi:glucose/arabinose dehydrogenase